MRNRRVAVKMSFKQNSLFGIEKMAVRQPSLVDSFYHEKSVCPDTGYTIVSYSHPLYMLFNQERINRLGDGAVQQWIKSLDAVGNSSLQELRKKCSDEDLMSLVKSRYCQSPSEIETWLNALNERADLFNSEVAKIVAQRKEEEAKRQELESQQGLTTSETQTV